jgi:hypothetical protein
VEYQARDSLRQRGLIRTQRHDDGRVIFQVILPEEEYLLRLDRAMTLALERGYGGVSA